MTFLERLSNVRPVLLDGPTGTELSRRGIPTDGPAWSAAAIATHPEVIRRIHQEYVEAGAEIVTANTFRTHQRNLQSTEWESRAEEMTSQAVALARSVADRRWVAGSMAPLEDCYRPDLVPSESVLQSEHAAMAEMLVEAGVDLILVETHNSVREARAATAAAVGVGLPVMVSVVCGADSRLLSGESLCDFAAAVLPFDPVGVLVNCLPAAVVAEAVDQLLTACGEVPVGAYANAGHRAAGGGWQKSEFSVPAVYAAAAGTWVERGVRIIGGCCGTIPAHISAIRSRLFGEIPPIPR